MSTNQSNAHAGRKELNMANKVITGKVRASFVHVFEPQSINGSEPKYSCSLIIPKSDTDTVGKIREAIEQAKQEGVPKWGGKIPPNLKLPLRDGDIDRPDDEAYSEANKRTAISLTPAAASSPAWWIAGAYPSPTRWRSIPAAMCAPALTSIPSMLTAIEESPQVWAISSSGATANR